MWSGLLMIVWAVCNRLRSLILSGWLMIVWAVCDCLRSLMLPRLSTGF